MPKGKTTRTKKRSTAGARTKRTSARASSRRKATAKTKRNTRTRASKSTRSRKTSPTRATARKSTRTRKSSTTRAKARSKTTKRPSARATGSRKSKPKAKTTTTARAAGSTRARKTSPTRAKTRPAARASRKATTRRKPTSRPKPVAVKRNAVKQKVDFDLNKWLLPTLELEQYEPDIQEEVGVEDRIKGSTRFAWIGAGQCGGRLVKSFHDLGYRKVIAVNTTHHDLDLLDIPSSQKFLMDIGEKGAGKDTERGRQATEQYKQEIMHLTRKTFGTQVDHIMVCLGAGGGTGSGSAKGLVEVAKRYARYIGISNPEKHVGVVMTLPTVGEASSPLVADNAFQVATELSEMAAQGRISPLIFVDNEKISRLYPGMTVKSFWPSINQTVAGLFDIFNRLSSLSSQYTSFDPVDYRSIMEAGGCAIMGLTRVDKVHDRFAISQAVKKNLEKTLLAGGFDLSSAKLAGSVVVGGKSLMARAKGLQDNINYAFDVLSEITGNATIHRGIYEDSRDALRVYTIIGGLDAPVQRLQELTSCTAVQAR